MAINIPDSDSYKEVEKAVERLAEIERRSKTQMSVILIEEAILHREALQLPTAQTDGNKTAPSSGCCDGQVSG